MSIKGVLKELVTGDMSTHTYRAAALCNYSEVSINLFADVSTDNQKIANIDIYIKQGDVLHPLVMGHPMVLPELSYFIGGVILAPSEEIYIVSSDPSVPVVYRLIFNEVTDPTVLKSGMLGSVVSKAKGISELKRSIVADFNVSNGTLVLYNDNTTSQRITVWLTDGVAVTAINNDSTNKFRVLDVVLSPKELVSLEKFDVTTESRIFIYTETGNMKVNYNGKTIKATG